MRIDDTTEGARAERRQLTVMFCDMTGSTRLADSNDPEDLREIHMKYRRICADAIQAHDGFVAQFAGDGVVAYFGYPEADEFAAENAVHSAMRIIDSLSETSDPPLRAHIGIATGTVVAGELRAGDVGEQHSIIGKAPNLADRMMKLAESEQIVIDRRTQEFVRDHFDLTSLGDHALKGFADPVPAWAVEGASAVRSGSQAIQERTELPKLIGRTQDFDLLLRCWDEAVEGQGQVVMIGGEPGIGKSRLVRHLKEHVADASGVVREFFFSARQQYSPMRAVVSSVENDLGIDASSPPDERHRRFRQYVEDTASLSDEEVALFQSFLSLDPPKLDLLSDKSREARYKATLRMLEDHIARYSSHGPALVVLEDVHWSDTTTLELVSQLVKARISALPMLLVITFRSGFVPPWPAEHYVTSLTLRRLSAGEAENLLAELSPEAPLPPPVAEKIIARSDGVPLFLEELYKATLESASDSGRVAHPGRQPLPDELGVPESLSASLMARLDRLGPVKRIAQIASVIGHRFSFELIQEVSPVRDRALATALERLEDAGIILSESAGAESRSYGFKHAMLRDAAYSSMLRSERRDLHARIAVTLESNHPDITLREPELLAGHCARGGLVETAIGYCLKAGQHAFQNSANSDAARHFTIGLELLKEISASESRDLREVELRVKLARSLHALHGGAKREVGENYARARDLAAVSVDRKMRFSILIGCWIYDFMSANLHGALKLAEEMLDLAEESASTELRAEANRVSGMTKLFTGNFEEAYDHLSTARALYDPEERRRQTALSGLDPIICCETYLGLSLAYLGRTQEAKDRSEHVLTSARNLKHPYSYVFSLALNALLRTHLDDAEGAAVLAGEAVEMALENGFGFWAKQQTLVGVWASADTKPSDAEAAEMRRAVDTYLEVGVPLESTRALTLLADIYQRQGKATEALEQLDAALDISKTTGEAFCLAEIHRLRGHLMCVTPGGRPEGYAEIQRALAVAERQNAVSWIGKIAATVAKIASTTGAEHDAALHLRKSCEAFGISGDPAPIAEAIRQLNKHLLEATEQVDP
ncbi:MAG: AAA family ATPase [Pseudomonadota bacterium]